MQNLDVGAGNAQELGEKLDQRLIGAPLDWRRLQTNLDRLSFNADDFLACRAWHNFDAKSHAVRGFSKQLRAQHCALRKMIAFSITARVHDGKA